MAKKVKPIPDGFHTVTPFLSIKGAEQAIQFYKKAFGAEELEKHNTPDGRVMHAVLKIGNSLVMLADEFPESPCGVISPLSAKATTTMLHIYVEDVDTAFDRAIKAGAKVKMPLADAFWGDRYGQIVDPFGHAWSLATHIADFSSEEIEEHSNAFMAEKKKKVTCC
jgi:PhnB protein